MYLDVVDLFDFLQEDCRDRFDCLTDVFASEVHTINSPETTPVWIMQLGSNPPLFAGATHPGSLFTTDL
jgi:hypothetical protein